MWLKSTRERAESAKDKVGRESQKGRALNKQQNFETGNLHNTHTHEETSRAESKTMLRVSNKECVISAWLWLDKIPVWSIRTDNGNTFHNRETVTG